MKNMYTVLDIKCFAHSRNTKTKRSVIYVQESQESVMDNLVKRHVRPKDDYRKVVTRLFPELTFRWSQKAGCSCPCSPGFIVQSEPLTILKDGWEQRCNMHITVQQKVAT